MPAGKSSAPTFATQCTFPDVLADPAKQTHHVFPGMPLACPIAWALGVAFGEARENAKDSAAVPAIVDSTVKAQSLSSVRTIEAAR